MMPMKLWLPFIDTPTGSTVYTHRLTKALEDAGHEVVAQPLKPLYELFPAPLRQLKAPKGTDLIVANAGIAAYFRRNGIALVAVEHHTVADPAWQQYASRAQRLYHRVGVTPRTRAGIRAADLTITVSAYTGEQVWRLFSPQKLMVILNGVETDWFTPPTSPSPSTTPFRLLFVGNHSRRKGTALLGPIMERLGDGFELMLTSGLRSNEAQQGSDRLRVLGRLDREGLRAAYRAADLLLFPSRFEGFGYAVAEAAACGLPAVAARNSALPEVIEHEHTGLLVPTDDVAGFVTAIRSLRDDPARLGAMRTAARQYAVERFSLEAMGQRYSATLTQLFDEVRSSRR